MFNVKIMSYDRTYFATTTLQYMLRLKDEELFNSIVNGLPETTAQIVAVMRRDQKLVYLTNDLTSPKPNSELLTTDDTLRTLYTFEIKSYERFICNSVLNIFGLDGLIDYIVFSLQENWIVLDRAVIKTLVEIVMYPYIVEINESIETAISSDRTFKVIVPQGQVPYNFDDYKFQNNAIVTLQTICNCTENL